MCTHNTRIFGKFCLCNHFGPANVFYSHSQRTTSVKTFHVLIQEKIDTFKVTHWRIQDFPEKGAAPKVRVLTYYFGQIFAENYMKMKKFGPRRGRRVSLAPLPQPLDPTLISCFDLTYRTDSFIGRFIMFGI